MSQQKTMAQVVKKSDTELCQGEESGFHCDDREGVDSPDGA